MKCSFGLAALLILLGLIISNASRPGSGAKLAEVDANCNILERFSVAKEGDVLLLPVLHDGKKHLFVLDTGSRGSVYDSSLKLGESISTTIASSPGGNVEINLYNPPPSKLGKIPVHQGPGPVASFDFTKLRQTCGEAIEGILGMDFLSQHVVQVDFDEGEVRLLKQADASCGKGIKIAIESDTPCIPIQILDGSESAFRIDTGATGTGYLEQALFQTGVDKKHFKVIGSTFSMDAAGTGESRLAVGKSLSVGDFKQNGPIVGESTRNILGLGFWSRFVVTFDFSNEMIYLKKGKEYERPDSRDLSGLHLVRVDGKTVIHSVDKDSAAAAKGIEADDQILRIGSNDVAKMSMFQLRLALSTPEQMARLVIRRGADDYSVELKMK